MKSATHEQAFTKIFCPILPKQEPNQSNYNYFLKLMQKLNKTSCVVFALYASKLIESHNPRVVNCINLVEKWLKNPESVTKIELRGVTNIYADWAAWIIINDKFLFYYAASAATHAIDADNTIKDKLLDYLVYLLPKEPKYNNFNIGLLKQNPQAYSFLEKVSKLEDWQVTDEDLFGIRQTFDVLEEVGAPLDPNEFQWEDNAIEKHKLLQAIRREFT